MKQESRMFIAVALCVAIYFVWLSLFPPAEPVKTSLENPNIAVEETQNTSPKNETSPVTPTLATPSEKETQALQKKITFETKDAILTLDTEGAKLVSLELKNYRMTAEKESAQKNLLEETPNSTALFLGLKEHPYLSEKKIYDVLEQTDNQITLVWQDDKVAVKKIFTLLQNISGYAVQVRYEIQNLSAQNLTLTPYWQNQMTQKEVEEPSGFLSFFSGGAAKSERYAPLYYSEESLKTYQGWDDFEPVKGSAVWSGISDRYFLLAVVSYPLPSTTQQIEYSKNDQTLIQKVSTSTHTLSPNQVVSSEILSYLGPKKTSELKLLNAGLETAIDYGWFGLLAQPILWLMQAIHSVIPSWGLAIILLTFIVKLLLYPINKKSMTSMKAMQQLQPKLKDIREKYSDDKQRQNQEVMQLFRTHKVNPLGGCLPMLLQLPIYFALYRVLWNAIELYHTPFLHYKDLSAPDPYFIAPILMGVFMVLQQKLTPNPSSDPSQKKMMMIMPVFFTFIMLFLPVGLVIYICVNTIMSVIQQYMMHKDISLRDVLFGRFKKETA